MATWRGAPRGRTAKWLRWIVGVGIACSALAAAVPAPGQQPAPRGEARTWTDISGKFSREAEFLRLEDGKVHLRLPSGKETSIPLKELSKKDRDWVRANGAPVGAGGVKGVATRIVIRSYEALVADSVILAQALEQQAFAGAVPGFFVALTGGKPLEGFDVKQPIVITIHVDGRGRQSGTMVAVPVTGRETFQKTLDAVFTGKTSPQGRSYEIPMLQRSVHAKPGDRYFLLSDSAEVIRAAAEPEAPVAVADVSAESFLAVMPEAERQRSLAEFEAMIDRNPLAPSAPEAERRSRQATSDWIKKAMRNIVADGDRTTFEASVDPTTRQTSISFGLRAKSGTPLAASFADYGGLRPRFVAAGNADAPGWVGVSMPKGEWLAMAVETVLGSALTGMRQALEAAKGSPGHAEAAAALGDLETEIRKLMGVASFEQEIVFTADASGAPRVVTRIAHDGAARFLAAMAKLTAVGAAAGTGLPDGDGILSVPMPPTGQQPSPFAAQPVRVAAAADAIVFGFGCPDTGPVKAMLAATASDSAPAPISARLDLAKLWPALAAASPATAALGDAVGEKGLLRADVNALADGIEARVNVDEGVLRLVGRMAGAFAAQVPGGPGFPGGQGLAPPGFPGPGTGPGLLPPSIQGFPVPPIPQPPAQPSPQ